MFLVHLPCLPADLFRKMDYRKPESTTINWLQNLLGQSAARGALSMVYTATAPELEGAWEQETDTQGHKDAWESPGTHLTPS